MDRCDFVYDDGGRAAAGFRGDTGDCSTRAIAIATGLPYRQVYDRLNEAAKRERPRKGQTRSNARTGVHTRTARRLLEDDLGWVWTPTMFIGSGCQVHLRRDELPAGRLVLNLSKHLAAVIDGTIHDTSNPDREGTRCVYGYWSAPVVACKVCEKIAAPVGTDLCDACQERLNP